MPEEFRKNADHALTHLKRVLYAGEEDGDYEVDEQNGALNIVFERPAGKFVITPNAPVKQIWVSALSTSFKLDWDEVEHGFLFAKTGESLVVLIGRLIAEHTGHEDFELG
jgi:frataxin